ncbi:hypothetical protein O3Q51_14355 [Cryomorphaceae bacterium 1068]|nr:hypothetical protein [Cryomorphaceae bacterium 1068]
MSNPTMKSKQLVYSVFLIGLIVLTFFGLGEDILYAQYGIKRWIPIILIFILVPFFAIMLAISIKNNQRVKNGLLILAVIMGPIFGLWHRQLSTQKWSEEGQLTKGIVSERWLGGRRGGKWNIKCEFKVKNTRFTTFGKWDREDLYRVGDTLTIQYAESNPNIHRILELED